MGVSQRARKTIKRQEGEEEEEEAAAEAAETTLAQADKQAYKLTARERERGIECSWRRRRDKEGRQDEYGQSFVLGRNFVAFVIVASFTCVFIYINTPSTHTHTYTHMHVTVSLCECVYSCAYVLFIFILFNAHQGKASGREKILLPKYLLLFYSKQKQKEEKVKK